MDLRRMSALLADDWVDVEDDDAMLSKDEALRLLGSPTTKLTRDSVSDFQVHSYGDVAVVTLLDSADFTVDGKDMGGEFRLTDVWVKRNGKWQMVSLHSSRIRK